MGIIRATLRLANDARPDLEEIEAEALVHTGALHLYIRSAVHSYSATRCCSARLRWRTWI